MSRANFQAEYRGLVERAIRLAKPTEVSVFVTPKALSGPAKSLTEYRPAGDHVVAWDTGLPPGEYEAAGTLEDYGVVRKQTYEFRVVVETPAAVD